MTRHIEGSDPALSPEVVAKQLLNGMRNGYFIFGDRFDMNLLRAVNSGLRPSTHPVLEVFMAPITRILGFGVRMFFDFQRTHYRESQE